MSYAKRVSPALDCAAEGGRDWRAALELARGLAWLVAIGAGSAAALITVAVKGHRPGSKAEEFAAILDKNPDMSAGRVNALMRTPFKDDRQVRRLASQHRKLLKPR